MRPVRYVVGRMVDRRSSSTIRRLFCGMCACDRFRRACGVHVAGAVDITRNAVKVHSEHVLEAPS